MYRKTTLVVAALRSPAVRSYFERIGWQPVSQTPNHLEIVAKLFKQLFELKLPDDAAADSDLAFQRLESQSKGRNFLVVLDDVRGFLSVFVHVYT